MCIVKRRNGKAEVIKFLDEIKVKIEKGYTFSYIYNELKDELDIGYVQFVRWVKALTKQSH